MRYAFRAVPTVAFLGAFLALAGAADADPFEDGQVAYDRHDYATALQAWRPLAEIGDVKPDLNT